jgi:uncharacterized protein
MGSSEKKTNLLLRKDVLLLAVLLVLVGTGAFFLQKHAWKASLLQAHFVESAKIAQSSNVYLRIASTPNERERGLMYEKNLRTDEGMLFVFEKEEEHSFWMKNTPLPLDIIFIDTNQIVVGIVKGAHPFSEESVNVRLASKYVVELNSGVSDALKVSNGSKIVFDGPVPKPVYPSSRPVITPLR